ncbi:Psy4p LALA0_S08e02762g [Lachancea lanzarotensis]|uniref:LALA0S08e02762g1_1 n=1 Tax=Lachancea lanzarotensis TaxID=1245769 RepID=A0A0C7NCT7_9SACH|nr:uncharacterized protein LALA0_S08e02762g [Lachancea lanzarotensis]CEP63451.1 LALA0S08e02762g1_1 [Lachancea lanzarotensis]
MVSNMMGIKADFLYKNLTRIVVEKDTSVFRTLPSRKLIPELLMHMTETIPNEIFEVNDDTAQLISRLQRLAGHLNSNFTGNDTYPFTIQRICEVCYHPLKYFKTHELAKFVNALERCCLVSSSLENDSQAPCENVGDAGDVSLKRICWVNESEEKGLAAFLREIETTVSVNFGYENEDDDDDIMNPAEGIDPTPYANDAEDDDEEDGDYVAGEEVKDEDEDEDDDEDEDEDEESDDGGSDDDHDDDEEEAVIHTGEHNSDDTQELYVSTETIETSRARTRGLRDTMSIDRRETVVEGAGAFEEEESTSEDDDPDTNDVIRKRKPTEMDVYEYEEKEQARITTPKKQRGVNTTATATLAHSPLFTQGSAVQSASLEQQISMLVSPSSVTASESNKITPISGEYLEKTSPLANKSGKR